jgi:hypothetical protein
MKVEIQGKYHAFCTWIPLEEVIRASRILFKGNLFIPAVISG